MDNFGLSEEQVAILLSGCMKPEEINGAQEVQHERVVELLHWFARYALGHANPKWLVEHAMELAYYIANQGVNRHLDMKEFKQQSFLEGVNITDTDRGILERLGVVQPRGEL